MEGIYIAQSGNHFLFPATHYLDSHSVKRLIPRRRHDLGWLTLEDVEEEGYDRLLGPRESDSESDYSSDGQ